VIRNQRGSDNNSNPGVYEEKTVLYESGGVEAGNKISMGGVYAIYPKRHIDTYRRFVGEQQEKMAREDVIADRALSFSADLLVEFSRVSASEFAVSETLTHGLRVPLSDEIYDVSATGSPSFELTEALREFVMPGIPVAALIALWFVSLALGGVFSIRRITMDKNKQRREVKKILKKYSDEIYISSHPADLSGYKTIRAISFSELLKLAVNLGKQIVCYHDGERADFCVFSDGYAFNCHFCFSDKEHVVKPEAS
jgi:hypothetical protein